MPDFVNGIKSASDYLNNTSVGLPTNVMANPLEGTVNVSMTQFPLKEIVCGLLAGNGFKLPNLQICLKLNLQALIDALSPALAALKAAFLGAMAALDAFIAHTGIDALLARINGFISEVAAIANMLNFCGTPVIPRAIPNVLRDMTGSFTGKGVELLDKLGKIIPSEIGGCVGIGGSIGGPGVNFTIFEGGVFGDMKNYLDSIGGDITDLVNAPQSVLDDWTQTVKLFTSDMKELVEFENNYADRATEGGSAGNGGSLFSPVNDPTRIHQGVGMSVDVTNMSFAEAQQKAMSLKTAYAQLKAYAVDEEGNNLFHYILEPELIARLENNDIFATTTQEQIPLYDYCGKIIGYTTELVNADAPTSTGAPTQPITSPSADVPEADETFLREDVPDTPIGNPGDKKGQMASNGEYLYVATADYDGVTAIWSRSSLSSTW